VELKEQELLLEEQQRGSGKEEEANEIEVGREHVAEIERLLGEDPEYRRRVERRLKRQRKALREEQARKEARRLKQEQAEAARARKEARRVNQQQSEAAQARKEARREARRRVERERQEGERQERERQERERQEGERAVEVLDELGRQGLLGRNSINFSLDEPFDPLDFPGYLDQAGNLLPGIGALYTHAPRSLRLPTRGSSLAPFIVFTPLGRRTTLVWPRGPS
jgi:hypothetical protein